MQEFSRKIRAKAVGILQRSQIIENEQRRKKKEVFKNFPFALFS